MTAWLGVLGEAQWPAWVGVAVLIATLTTARLLCERARRRTLVEVMGKCRDGAVLVDASRSRCLIVWRPVDASNWTPTIVRTGRHR
jgi:hypothetical protein